MYDLTPERIAAVRSRLFPLQTQRDVPPGPREIPWAVAEIAYGAYAARYGTGQSIERMAERGGFGWGEMDMFHPKWREEVSEITRLQKACDLFEANSKEASEVFEVLIAAGLIPAQKPGPRLGEIVQKLVDQSNFMKAREKDICAAVGGVSDGGQYRNDVIEHLKMVFAENSKLKNDLDVMKTEVECWRAGVLHPDPTINAEVMADLAKAKAADIAAGLNTGDEPDTHDCTHPATCGFCRARESTLSRMRDRLQIDPGGSDKIDELEQALQFAKHDVDKYVDMYKRASQERIEAQNAVVELGRERDKLKAEIKGYNFCEKHKWSGGTYANCLHCGMIEVTRALDDIDLLTCDAETREMGGNLYGVDCHAPGVVERIKKVLDNLTDALTKAAEMLERKDIVKPEALERELKRFRALLKERAACVVSSSGSQEPAQASSPGTSSGPSSS